MPTRDGSAAEIAEVLRATVLRAGALLRSRLGAPHQVRHKGEIDLVTEMDRAVEALFERTLRRRFPGHALLSEEREEAAGRDPWTRPAGRGWRWIVDPLDGTTNYAHGFPHFAVSAGLEFDGRVRLGAVYDPMQREFYFARLGHGAWRNGRPIRVSDTARLGQALLATGFPYDVRTSRERHFEYFQAMAVRSQAVRRAGAAALDLADVAAGRFDGFWEMNLKPWDVAAGSLLITEAGGRITGFSGRGFDLYGGSFIASNGRLHAALRRVLEETRKRPPARPRFPQPGPRGRGAKEDAQHG